LVTLPFFYTSAATVVTDIWPKTTNQKTLGASKRRF